MMATNRMMKQLPGVALVLSLCLSIGQAQALDPVTVLPLGSVGTATLAVQPATSVPATDTSRKTSRSATVPVAATPALKPLTPQAIQPAVAPPAMPGLPMLKPLTPLAVQPGAAPAATSGLPAISPVAAPTVATAQKAREAAHEQNVAALLRNENARLHARVKALNTELQTLKLSKPYCSDLMVANNPLSATSSTSLGKTHSCLPNACNPVSGQCYENCNENSDVCALGYLCKDGTCVRTQ